MMDRPIRVQLRRGQRMQPNTVRVDRATKFGNPFRSDQPTEKLIASGAKTAAEAFGLWLEGKGGLHDFETKRRDLIFASLADLRGKNLACWCRPGSHCHADILLRLANG